MNNSLNGSRDETGVESETDSEFIDDSLVENVTYSSKKKNHTVFVAESDESSSNDESMKEDDTEEKVSKSLEHRSGAGETSLVSSSEDDVSRRGSIRRPSASENNMVVTSSEDEEEEFSPELVPRRRKPPQKPIDSDESLILHRTKKRMLFLDSDTDNSIVIEHHKNKKHPCLQETPLKIDDKKNNVNKGMDVETSDDNTSNNDESEHKTTEISSKYKRMVINTDESADEDENPSKTLENGVSQNSSHENSDHGGKNDDINGQKTDGVFSYGNDYYDDDDDDDGPDEDMMVMSRATRMSILGVMPKDNDSDESDFLQSESSSRKSRESIAGSIEDLPEVSIHNTPEETTASDDKPPEQSDIPEKPVESDDDLPEVTLSQTLDKSIDPQDDGSKESEQKTPEKSAESDDDLPEVTIHSNDTSRISCSPFSSPLHDITNDNHSINNTKESRRKSKAWRTNAKKDHVTDFMDLTINTKPKDLSNVGVIDLSNVKCNDVKNVFDMSASVLTKKKAVFDDDVTIIDTKPEVIALSSDDEDEQPKPKQEQPPRPSKPKSPRGGGIKQYLAPASYPAQPVFVKRHVRENELSKLARLKEDLASVRMLLEEMDMDALPDGGSRLVQRLGSLEAEVRRQGDKVANMLVEPDEPTAEDIARDGFDKGLSWEDIQKASNAVQPRMFGKQAMATHLAERSLILSSLRDLHASLASRPAATAAAPAPACLASTLLPYQRHALAWLRWRETQKPSAGILADDMGLGKTITMIALVAADKQDSIDHDDEDEGTGGKKSPSGGTLVVCPASLLQQWAGEVGKHTRARTLTVRLHHGAARATHPHALTPHDIVVTTYNILQRDNEKKGVLMRIQWRRIILDEAHIVRNYKSATSVAVCNLKGKRRWCLTGTPVQNKDLDLFALLKFLRCSPFDDLQMWKKWIDNKSQGGQERLSTIMQCILLRRTKAQLQKDGQLAALPAREAHVTLVTLTKEEMNVYQKVLVLSKTLFAQFLKQRAERRSGAAPAASARDSEYHKMHKRMVALQGVKPVKSHEILVLLLRLRQVCCHCGLIAPMLDEATAAAPEDPASSDLLRELDKLSLEDQERTKNMNPDQEDPDEILTEESAKADEAIRAVLSPNNPVFQLTRPSSKIAAVMACLDENVFKNKGVKAVVVSQWTSVLSLVQRELAARRVGCVTLSGTVPVPARPPLIDKLNDPNSDVKVMLLSLCAGGVGINLCGASHLLLLDPHWNPQLEQQAQDRVYRIGQQRDVHVYRFVCVDTVEQSIRKLQEAKLQLAENVLTGAGSTAASTLSIEDLKMLFNMGTQSSPT